MASHRSPSGADADDPARTTRLRVTAPAGSRRLPPPPAATTHGRATVAAVAAGAVVAAGQTLVGAFAPGVEPPVASTLQPVAAVAHLPAERADDRAAVASMTATTASGSAQRSAVPAIGGQQLLPATPGPDALDAGNAVDIANLTKGALIGAKVAKSTALVDSALADGAAEAHVIDGRAIVRPTIGRFTSGFGARWGTSHNGIDIANAIGTPIYALMDGEVVEAGPASGFGLWVVLRHADGTKSVYGHVNRMFVEVGQQVHAGEQIAEIGNRGQSTGPHLHLEIWQPDGTKINPLPWLEAHDISF